MNLIKVGGLEAGLTIPTDKEGYPILLVVVKATYTVRPDGRCVLARPQIPPTKADVHLGEPGLSSVVYETDYSTKKQKTDVLINGHAYPPGGRPAEVVDATVRVGPLTKTIRVFGDRIWKPGLVVGVQASSPIPFVKMPLVYERAFGGVDRTVEKEPRYDMRNPVGCGFHRLKAGEIVGTLLPNLENPAALIGNPYDTPEPRRLRSRRPRLDAAQQVRRDLRSEMAGRGVPVPPEGLRRPLFPVGAAGPDLRPAEGRRAGRAGPSHSGRTPGIHPPVADIGVRVLRKDGEDAESLTPVLDTVLLEPDQRRCILVWRASERLKGKPSRILEIHAGAWSPGRRKAEATDKEFLDWTPRR